LAYNPSGYALGFGPTSRCHKKEFLLKFAKRLPGQTPIDRCLTCEIHVNDERSEFSWGGGTIFHPTKQPVNVTASSPNPSHPNAKDTYFFTGILYVIIIIDISHLLVYVC
jgi:hypothetical protein